MAIITLTTDFGKDEEYVGLLKAAILTVDPAATVVDITHGIDAQDTRQAAFSIETSWRFFPAGTTHVVVVDPGVGTERAIIALAFADHFFIAPDNGVLSLIIDRNEPCTLVRLENKAYWRAQVSPTFHGRDIMAPAAAHLGRGLPLTALGPVISRSDVLVSDELRASCAEGGQIAGTIIAVDRYGNLITNISSDLLPSAGDSGLVGSVRMTIGGRSVGPYVATYAGAAMQTPLALIGSRGYLEIAVNRGNASKYFQAGKGDRLHVQLDRTAERSTGRTKNEEISR